MNKGYALVICAIGAIKQVPVPRPPKDVYWLFREFTLKDYQLHLKSPIGRLGKKVPFRIIGKLIDSNSEKKDIQKQLKCQKLNPKPYTFRRSKLYLCRTQDSLNTLLLKHIL